MLFTIISLAILAVGIIIFCISCRSYYSDLWDWLSVLCLVIGIITSSFSLIWLGVEYIPLELHVSNYSVEYEMLTYQVENQLYDNENDINKYELINDIESWNKWVKQNHVLKDSIWFNWFVPNEMLQFETIDYTAIT